MLNVHSEVFICYIISCLV